MPASGASHAIRSSDLGSTEDFKIVQSGTMVCRQGRASGLDNSPAAGQSSPGQAVATTEAAVPELRLFGGTLPKTQQPNEEDAACAPPPEPLPQAESPVTPAKQQQQLLLQQQQGPEPLAAQRAGTKGIERWASGGRRLTPFPHDLASADGGFCGEQHDCKAVTIQPGEPGSRLATSDSPDGSAEGQPPVPEAGLMGSSMDVSTAGAEAPLHQPMGEAGMAADGAQAPGRPRASSAADDPFSTGRQAQLTSQTVEFQAATAAEHQADAEMGRAAADPSREDAAPLPPATGEEAAATAVEPASPGPAPFPTLPFYRQVLSACSTAQLLHLLIQQI